MFLPRFPILGSAFFILLACFLSLSPLQAQLVVEEEGDSLESALSDYWDKHFSFRFGATVSSGLGTSDSRKYSFANLTWKHDFGWVTFNFEGEAYRREYTYALKPRSNRRSQLERDREFAKFSGNTDEVNRIDAEIADLDREFVFTAGEAETFYREASAKLSLSDTLQLSLGYHTIVWGQVSGFSPVDYVLPPRIASGNLSFSKTNNRLPQQAAILYFFPIPQIEFQAYYFPELTIDTPLRAFFENEVPYEELQGSRSGFVEMRGLGFEYPQKDEEAQYAGRLLFYFDWITFAFVYHDGWDHISKNDGTRIEKEARQIAQYTDLNGTVINNINVEYYRTVEEPRMNRVQTYGFESAIPIGRWTLAFDISERAFPQSIGAKEIRVDVQNWGARANAVRARGGVPHYTDDGTYMVRQALIDYAINENEGTFAYKQIFRIWALEFTADLDKWVYGLGLAGGQFEIRDEKDKKLVELHENLVSIGGSFDRGGGDEDLGVFPFINVGRYVSEDKKDIIGMSLVSLVA